MTAASQEAITKELPPISPVLYQDLIHYFKYASSAYTPICPRPNGRTLVMQISNPYTDVRGFVARDDSRKEIVVALKGSASVTDALLDFQLVLVPFICPGCEPPSGALVHSGFLAAWNSVVLEVGPTVQHQVSSHKGYTLITTGHSLGGALATLAAVHLKYTFKENLVKIYSYGAPRLGNKAFADYINTTFGENSHRVVHRNDGSVPTMIPRALGYHHHGIEYWQHEDPPSEETTLRCNAEGEDSRCSASIPSQGVNVAHTMYFGIVAMTPFCL